MIAAGLPLAQRFETPFTLADVTTLDFQPARLPDCTLLAKDPIGSRFCVAEPTPTVTTKSASY